MQVRLGKHELEMGGPYLTELRQANELLDDREQLHARFEQDGYLLLRGLLDREKVLAARERILRHMDEQQALAPGQPVLEGVMQAGRTINMMGSKPITHDPAVKAVLEGEELFDFYEHYFGEPARTFDYKWLRAVGNEQSTGAHYDVVYMGQGSGRLMTCWIPFNDTPIEHGTLAICPGSHNLPGFEKVRRTYGKMDVDRDGIQGWFSQDAVEIVDKYGGPWATTNYRAGDVITFGMFTMHMSTVNTTDRFRLSCDTRFQPAADPVDERWVGENPVNHYAVSRKRGELKSAAEARAEWGV